MSLFRSGSTIDDNEDNTSSFHPVGIGSLVADSLDGLFRPLNVCTGENPSESVIRNSSDKTGKVLFSSHIVEEIKFVTSVIIFMLKFFSLFWWNQAGKKKEKGSGKKGGGAISGHQFYERECSKIYLFYKSDM